MEQLLTKAKKRKIERNEKIVAEYYNLLQLGNTKTAISQFLCEKYNINSESTIYRIVKRYEETH